MAEENTGWVVVTGSTGGIGSEIVSQLAAAGRALILLNRSRPKAEAQLSTAVSSHPGLKAELVDVDLMDIESITAATDSINKLPGRIDLLFNNAGVLTGEKRLSAQGFESHFAVNTLAPYQLIRNLRDKMTRPLDERPAMVVNFSSSAISQPKSLELTSLPNPEKVGGLMTTYAKSKLAVTAMAAALAEELQRDNILIRAIDPGPTKTGMTTGGNSGMPWFLRWIAPLLFSPADRQAAKVIEGSDPTSFDGATGIYVANMRQKKIPDSVINAGVQRSLIELLDRSLQTNNTRLEK